MFVSNDWHAALVPSYLAAKYRRYGVYQARGSSHALLCATTQSALPSVCVKALNTPLLLLGVLGVRHADRGMQTGTRTAYQRA